MRIRLQPRSCRAGIALIIVLVSIFVLAMLAGGFAYSMKVETKLASNANFESELLWLGRSGVEMARYVLGQQLTIGCEPYDALNQVWAGGSGSGCMSNSPLEGISLQNIPLANGVIRSVTIVDCERKVNINQAGEPVLQQALILMGLDASELPTIVSPIQDWIDPDKSLHISGAESQFYQGFDPPYVAKDGPIDDMAELQLVNGMTPELYWGPKDHYALAAFQARDRRPGYQDQPPLYTAGLMDLFTPLGMPKININTASAEVLQLIPGIDVNLAQAIVAARSEGAMPGDPFIGPFVNLDPNYLWRKVPGLSLEGGRMLQQYCDVRSRTFQVTVEVEAGGYQRTFVAVLGRNSPRDVQVLTFYAK